jgi:hypothetical protein
MKTYWEANNAARPFEMNFTSGETSAMRRHLNGIDHCVALVRDFELAHNAFTRLGFTVSPLGRHGAEMGTGNHTVMFDEDYFELLGVLQPNGYNQEIRDLVTVREGIAAIALRTDDAAAAAAELQAAGITAGKPQTVRRSVALPDGGEAEAAFTIAFFTEATTPYLRWFCSQIQTPEYTWFPSLMKHANTAWGIDHIAVVTETPDALASDIARIFDTSPHKIAEKSVSVATGGAPIVYMTPAALAVQYPVVDLSAVASAGPAVLSIKVHDAKTAAECLRRSGVTFATTASGLLVPPQDACGVLLALREVSKQEGRGAMGGGMA